MTVLKTAISEVCFVFLLFNFYKAGAGLCFGFVTRLIKNDMNLT